MALVILIKGQLSRDCEECGYEEPFEARLERDYDLDDQDPSEPVPTKKQLDIDLLAYRLRDPRLTNEEKLQIKEEIVKTACNDE